MRRAISCCPIPTQRSARANDRRLFVRVYNHFGPTYPGTFDEARSVYLLGYPGVAFEFTVPRERASLYKQTSLAELPLEFDDGSSPFATRITVVENSASSGTTSTAAAPAAAAADDASAGAGAAAASASARMPPSVSMDKPLIEAPRVLVHIGVGIQLGSEMISFSSSAQDVLSTLGQPNRVHSKRHDKLRIHAAAAARPSSSASPLADYFYNYFDLGIDFLFDGARHSVKKILLHTNFPSHTAFNRYAKCAFRVIVPHDDAAAGGASSVAAAVAAANSALASEGSSGSDGGSSTDGDEDGSAGGDAVSWIGPNTRFARVQALLGAQSQPVVHNRGASENPFGALLFYGYHDIIFEVMQNGYLASICLFSESNND
eukprot:TRINITY_DN1743_c0_g1_i1.p1 TRINITY_DN1743_c0_g1~~TRINITY_DN1743_c0_g1_i1.p1  ORF type:complete len:375 (+),score=177.22 TRINITY_DN1743_c0_g1_i1:286-1410(+)